MTDLELKQQDELVNTMIAHYQAVIDGYKKSIEDAIAEMQHLHDLYKINFQGHSMSVTKDCIDIIRKHTGIPSDEEMKYRMENCCCIGEKVKHERPSTSGD